MYSELYWVSDRMPGKLALMARPRAGDWLEDEIGHWQASGINAVVSLLEAEEVSDLGLQRERALCEQHGIDFLSFPIVDRGVPASMRETKALAESCLGVSPGVRRSRSIAAPASAARRSSPIQCWCWRGCPLTMRWRRLP
ncbi:MAG: hypothetical protein ABI810_00840 [Sphingomonas bacterium]